MNWLPALSLTLTVAAPLPKEPKKADPPAIVGTWVCSSITDGGRPNTADVEGGLLFEFTTDGKIHVTKDGKPKPDGTYTADPKTAPAQIDLRLDVDAPLIKGIFKVEVDVFTLCFDDGHPDRRPSQFASPKDTTLMVVTLRRMARTE